jgi:hypothetical protein
MCKYFYILTLSPDQYQPQNLIGNIKKLDSSASLAPHCLDPAIKGIECNGFLRM